MGATRKALFEKYGHWKLAVAERDVMWWSGLNEFPPDVHEFMEWLCPRFPNILDAFFKIDGPGGNGVVSLREFEEGLQELGCKKFAGRDEMQRIGAIFRYLDPSGEGGISPNEWMVLDQLWKEMQLSLKEFVQFMSRAFDKTSNFLAEAWEVLDDDESGEISLEEWQTLVQEKFHYFGPSTTIFNFLDEDDKGTISREDFETLPRFPEWTSEKKK